MVKMWRTDIVARLVAIRDQHGSRIPQADEPTAETVAPEAVATALQNRKRRRSEAGGCLHCGGQRFESPQLHQLKIVN
jgi:hypothetical protein